MGNWKRKQTVSSQGVRWMYLLFEEITHATSRRINLRGERSPLEPYCIGNILGNVSGSGDDSREK